MNESQKRLVVIIALIVCVVFAFWRFTHRPSTRMAPIYRSGAEGKKHIPYFEQRPPRCLTGFRVSPTKIPGYPWWGGHGALMNTVFALNCTCGHGHFHVLGHYMKSPSPRRVRTVFVGPIALKCDSCDKITELIDTNSHGYDAELGHGSVTLTGQGERVPFSCAKCGVKAMEIIVRFDYTPDVLEEDFSDFRGREQDLFTWFTLLGRCEGCDKLLIVTEFECA